MDPKLVESLRCPVSGEPLHLETIEADSLGQSQMVKTGTLFCTESCLWYPVINYIPVLLTFATDLVGSRCQRG